VQQSLTALLDLVKQGVFDLETIVQKTSHNVAIRYQIANRGFIREGYAADLVLVDLNHPHIDTQQDNLYQCGWSPWDGQSFSSSVISTFVNGNLKYHQGQLGHFTPGQRLQFTRD